MMVLRIEWLEMLKYHDILWLEKRELLKYHIDEPTKHEYDLPLPHLPDIDQYKIQDLW